MDDRDSFRGMNGEHSLYLAIYELEDMKRDFREMVSVKTTPSSTIDPKSNLVLFDEMYSYEK